MVETNFEGIYQTLELLDDDEIPNEDKPDYITALLNCYGLMEYTKKNDKEVVILTDPKEFIKTINPVQLFDINFRNGVKEFLQNLN